MRARLILIPAALLGLALLIALSSAGSVLAAPPAQSAGPTPDPRLSISNDVCLSCHGQPGQTMTLGNGDVLDLYVPASEYNTSVHGIQRYACVQCHRTVGNYPHPPFEAANLRDASVQLYAACQGCHQHQYELAADSVHSIAFKGGNRAAAICTDCHGSHTVRRLRDPDTHEFLPDSHEWIPQTCSKCHSAIYEKYKDSVHGSALIGEGNQDVPTCIDCHGVHNINNPTTAAYRLNSPQMCARCHTDEQKMEKYGLSTDVLDTYVSDFHGTTVTLFEKTSPDGETNKPVCFDCHGVHDISAASDPAKGLQVRQNILARCQACHPDATENFPTAWMSHYIPSPEKNPVVYYVELFYKFLIPVVLGGMALLVVLDLNKTVGGRVRKSLAVILERAKAEEPPAEEPPSKEQDGDQGGQS